MLLEQDAVVSLDEGLHARPAARLAQLAKSFQSSIEIHKGGASANAKSTVKIMLLTVKQGERVRIRVEGEDAVSALAELVAYVGGAAPLADAPPALPQVSGRIEGACGNEGVAIGPAFLYLPDRSVPPRRSLAAGAIGAEIERFRAAVLEVCDTIEAARADGAESTEAQLFAALRELAEDVELLGPIEQAIAGGQDAASATIEVSRALAERFERIDDAYFRLRADDVRGIGQRLADVLLGRRGCDLAALSEPSILVASELSALDFARLPAHLVLGLLTTAGGPTSHIAIIARALGFPAVVGARAHEDTLRAARLIALDGGAGLAILNPDPTTQAAFARRRDEADAARVELERFAHIAPRTRDGSAIEVAANIGAVAEIEPALRAGAMGVGLFRTEFMFMRNTALPSEEEQLRTYTRVLSAFAPHPVLIRTLDIGGDKPMAGMQSEAEANPFLGWRGIRMCLDRPELFDPQLRALLRAAVHGRLRVMFPMISDVSEVLAAKARLSECREALHAQGQETGPIELGIMIETPAAALCAHALAQHVDFFSIGTNDLTQYTMAADRTNARLARLSRADHPAVLRMIELACDGAREAGIWIGVCGEAAGDPAMIPRLLSWGVSELSMSPSLIARAKRAVTEYGA
ncbi:phosphoenolpyruvate--protein phosphotransferase [Lichenicoccus sp.]|uniref:phosphoenolpyruvate--protein phosphotransferase n=1 Tax=Lichenicoccus sp. TaxID=2781899 RepID=UPI003D0F17EF